MTVTNPPRGTRSGAETDTREQKGPSWAKIDRAIIESGLDPWAFKLYAFLAGRQGEQGYETFGQQYVAARLGLNRGTVAKHAEVLRRLGFIEVIWEGKKKAHYNVIHNPPWGKVNPDVQIPPVETRYARKGYRGPEATSKELANAASIGGVACDTSRSVASLACETGQSGALDEPPLSSKVRSQGISGSSGLMYGKETEVKGQGRSDNRIDPAIPPAAVTSEEEEEDVIAAYVARCGWEPFGLEVERILGEMVAVADMTPEDRRLVASQLQESLPCDHSGEYGRYCDTCRPF